ncbi:pilin [Halioxenophilus sp. WMMB6]|uniref:pilin n=1 Tax=Halioxenophilus sp. WMMB6 TaxID=3073815 RepID=UPI00295E98F9|nr:pilin [Halioxenophilus sp. WMMB6]
MQTFCTTCGRELPDNPPQCPGCGAIQENFVYRSRVAASALAVFAGIFGAHRFYLGQWWGVFYILFFWTYIPWLVGVIEGIVFLATSQKEWNRRYNQGLSLGREKGTVVAVFLLILPAFMVIGILAAVAIPAYQDYTVRAKTAEAQALASSARAYVEEYVYDNQELPSNLAAMGLSEADFSGINVASVAVADGAIYVTLDPSMKVEGKLIYVPTLEYGEVSWSCTESTLPQKYLPSECRW